MTDEHSSYLFSIKIQLFKLVGPIRDVYCSRRSSTPYRQKQRGDDSSPSVFSVASSAGVSVGASSRASATGSAPFLETFALTGLDTSATVSTGAFSTVVSISALLVDFDLRLKILQKNVFERGNRKQFRQCGHTTRFSSQHLVLKQHSRIELHYAKRDTHLRTMVNVCFGNYQFASSGKL
jgi:hypothetical protein